MNYVKVTNGVAAPYALSQIRQDFPGVSMATEGIPPEEQSIFLANLAALNIFPLAQTTAPEDPVREVVEDTPVQVNGTWEQRWKLVDVSNGEAVRRLRAQIALRMFASDFTQLADSGLTAGQVTNWATYRTALRALYANATPNSATWPTPPAAGGAEYDIRLALLKRLAR